MQLNSKYLSKTNTDCLKGLLALCVLACHLWSSLTQFAPSFAGGVLGRVSGVVLMAFGYLSVSMFFFLSGYGLMVQYQKRRDSYMKSFLQKRVLPLYMLCVCLILFYWAVRTALGEHIAAGEILQSFFFGKTVISKGWYLQSILVWYLLFFVCFRFVKDERNQLFALLGAYVLYIALCLVLKLDHTWYECALCLPIGVYWAKYQESLDARLKQTNKYAFAMLIVLFAFAVSFVLGNIAPLPTALKLLIKCISSNLFVISVVLLLKLIPIENFITRFLGKFYLEIYAIHGFVLMLYHSKFICIDNPVIYSLAVLATTIPLAWVISPIFKKILQLGKGTATKV